jgi:transposase InsO family protein
LAYEAAMRQSAAATCVRLMHHKQVKTAQWGVVAAWRSEQERRAARYRVRQQRQQEDLTWQAAKAAWRQTRQTFQAGSRAERRAQAAAYQEAQQQWQQDRQQRRAICQQRPWEDQTWHQRNRERTAGEAETAAGRTWIAILVVTDNCTRQCLGLPLFRSGAHITSEEVVEALRTLLPAELAFLISDQGIQFRSKAFAQLAQEADFVHVPVYRHRPESNGIAERFVLTLKAWLQSQFWQEVLGLAKLLAEFQPDYNQRPHQGLAIPGLSPDEFAKRIWLM